MSAQLLQLLGYLDREGVTELVLATGRQIAARVGSAYKPLMAAALTRPQLLGLIEGTPLVGLVPELDGNAAPVDLDIGGRLIRVQFARRGEDLLLRIEPGTLTIDLGAPPAGPAPISAPIPAPISAPTRPTPAPVAAPVSAPVRPPLAPIAAAPPRAASTPVVASASASVPAPVAPPAAVAPLAPRRSGLVIPPPPPEEPLPPLGDDEEHSRLINEVGTVVDGLRQLVVDARGRGASDLHVSANRPVQARVAGELTPLTPTPLPAVEAERLLLPLLGATQRRTLDRRGYVDLALDVPGAGRLRSNISRQQGGLKGSFRLILPEPPTLESLGLPKELAKVVSYHQGLVVIAGPNGHGKTTTLGALVDLINRTKAHHILTIEDPIEILHPRKVAKVSQREVGRHTKSFAAALKASLREDPDVIVIGELRDRETVEIALTAAETGHLVMATMSTPSAAKTIDRLIDMFPPDDQTQVRTSLAGALKFIVSQRLLPRAGTPGVVAAVEVLTGVLPVAALIRDNKLYQLPNLMQRGRAFGMIRFDDSLLELVRGGQIEPETALRVADSKKEMTINLGLAAAPSPTGGAPQVPQATAKSRLGGLFGKKDPS
jgi:twitching motility protein PilT